MWEWLNFTPIQWGCIVFSFIVCAVVTERTLVRSKRESIAVIMGLFADAGLCDRCLIREKKRLERLDYATVETERIMREKSVSVRI